MAAAVSDITRWAIKLIRDHMAFIECDILSRRAPSASSVKKIQLRCGAYYFIICRPRRFVASSPESHRLTVQ